MLINSYEHNVDAKGRVFIPAKWRDDLGDTVIVTRGFTQKGKSRCLFGMSCTKWESFLEKQNSLSMTDIVAQNAMRQVLAFACDCELDKQGRILLPQGLRTFAGIDKDAELVGMGNRIEIWDTAAWTLQSEADGELGDETLEHLMRLGI